MVNFHYCYTIFHCVNISNLFIVLGAVVSQFLSSTNDATIKTDVRVFYPTIPLVIYVGVYLSEIPG